MSEVEKFKCIGYMVGRSRIGGAEWVMLSDFDRLTKELEESRARENQYRGQITQQVTTIHELKQRLTAADERADVLEGLLNKALELLRGTHTGELFGPNDWAIVDEFLAGAALKPAEGGGDGRNYHFETGPYEVELGREKWAAVHEVFKTFNNSDTPDEDFTCSECELNGLVSGILIELKLAAPE